MPIIDKRTRDRLILVKQLYQQGLVQSDSRNHLVSRIMSVISFDLAVETILKLIINVLDPHSTPNPKTERNFPQYRDYADKLMIDNDLGPLSDKRRITDVHSIRNDAQHNAKYPDPSEVSDCRTYIRDFLYQTTVQVWQLPFDRISLSELVQHRQPKRFLVAAEEALVNNDYKAASGQAVAAITWTLERVGTKMVGPSEDFRSFGEFLVKGGGTKERTGQIMYEAFWQMQDTLRIIALGLNHADYIHYKETLRDLGLLVLFPMRGEEPGISYKPHVSIIGSTAEYLVSYAVDTVLQIETLVGNLDSPFGERLRYMDGRSEPCPTR